MYFGNSVRTLSARLPDGLWTNQLAVSQFADCKESRTAQIAMIATQN